MVLYRQGYYKEMPHADASDPSMRDHIGKQISHKEEICKYLQSGMVNNYVWVLLSMCHVGATIVICTFEAYQKVGSKVVQM